MARTKRLLVIGDSHSLIFEGSELPNRISKKIFRNVRVRHLGPALAWNLIDEDGENPGKWLHEIIALLDREPYLSETSHVMLCFGEIDLRNWKKAVTSIARRVVKAMRFLQDTYPTIEFMLVSPPPACESYPDDERYPTVGSVEERNRRIIEFYDLLVGEPFFLFNIHLLLSGANGYALTGIFSDGIHLNLTALDTILSNMRIHFPQYAAYFDEREPNV